MYNNSQVQKRVAILIENGVEDSEFLVPYNALKLSPAEVQVLGSRMNEKYKGKQGKMSITADATTTDARPENFDAVIIPGGMAPDKMRCNPNTVKFVQDAMAQGKLIAAICHGPQVLIEADLLRDKRATGFIAIRKDMMNAGANYIDEPLVIDGNLITSRLPGDLAIFTTAILTRLGLGGKQAQLPTENDPSVEWWKLADAWGGSTRGEIVKALNMALTGERYSREEFEQYIDKTSNSELQRILLDIIHSKQHNIEKLETRLSALGEKPSVTATVAEPVAKLKTALESSDDIAIIRRALGDLQTGVVDTFNLYCQYTDPISTELFREIEISLSHHERILAEYYHSKIGFQPAQAPKPTPIPTMG